MVDQPETPAESAHAPVPAPPGSASVVLASFESSGAAERMVASLGRGFRREARSGKAAAFVVTRGHDNSFKIVQSRVLTAGGVVAAAMTLTAALLAGLMGMMSALRGAKAWTHAVRKRQSHVGRDDDQLAAIFDQVGPHGACVLFHCTDEQTAQAVAARAGERGNDSAQYSRAEFLALLDGLGDKYDWVRPAVAEPSTKANKNRRSARTPPASA